MPDISPIRQNNKKKIDVSLYFGENAFIHVRKLSMRSRKMIQLLTMDSGIMKLAEQMLSENKKVDFENIDNNELGLMFMKLPSEAKKESQEAIDKIEDIYLNEGIDPDDHNLISDGEKIKLNGEFWQEFPKAAIHVISQIKKFNLDTEYSLGEQPVNNLIM